MWAPHLYYAEQYGRSYYMLGQVHERAGDQANAVASYKKFLELWKNADAGLPEVADARKRLAALN